LNENKLAVVELYWFFSKIIQIAHKLPQSSRLKLNTKNGQIGAMAQEFIPYYVFSITWTRMPGDLVDLMGTLMLEQRILLTY
jgi:hypothetical protein